jgi:hypothetical protein
MENILLIATQSVTEFYATTIIKNIIKALTLIGESMI